MKPCCCNKQIEEARKKAEAERLANNEAHQMRLAAEQAELKQRLSLAASKGRDEKVVVPMPSPSSFSMHVSWHHPSASPPCLH